MADTPKIKFGVDIGQPLAAVKRLTKDVEDANKQSEKAIERTRKAEQRFTDQEIQNARKRRDAIVAAGGRGSRALKSVEFEDLLSGGGTALNLSPLNHREADRIRLRMLAHLGLGGAGGGGIAGFGGFAGSTALMAGRGVFGAALPIYGVPGSILSHSAGAARAAGGLLSRGGLSRLVMGGGMAGLAYAGIRAFGAVRAKIGSAQDESSSYADTLRRVGGTARDFDALRDSVRAATAGLGLAFNESAKLAATYAHDAALPPGERRALGQEVGTGSMFSRAFGIDPSEGVGFLGTMRRLGVTNSDRDNRRLAGQIGEVLESSGSTARMSEVLQTIEEFTKTVAARTLQAGNVAGMLGMTATLSGLGIKGFTADRAASLAGALDHGFASGAGGMAGDNMLLSVLHGRAQDIGGMDVTAIKEGGYFGTAEKVFGKGSTAYQLALKRGNKEEVARRDRIVKMFGANEALGDVVMRGLLDFYRGDTRSAISAGSNMLGISQGQAAAALMAVMNGGSAPRPDADLKRPVQSEGDKTRNAIASLGNTMQVMAASVVPLLTNIRDGVVKLAEHFHILDGGTLSKMQIDDANAVLDTKMSLAKTPEERRRVLTDERARAIKAGMPQGYIDSLTHRIDSKGGATGDWSLGKPAAPLPPWIRKLAAGQGVGTPKDLAALAALYSKESSSGRNARTSVDGAEGGFQVTPATYRDMMGTNEGRDDPTMNALAAIRRYAQLKAKAKGDVRLIGAGYIGGPGAIGSDGQIVDPDVADGLGTTRAAYADDFERRVAATMAANQDATVPADSTAAQPRQASRAEITGNFTLRDSRGREVADPLFITTLGAPRAAGAVAP